MLFELLAGSSKLFYMYIYLSTFTRYFHDSSITATHTHAHTTCTHAHMCMCMHTCACACACACACNMCMCMCIVQRCCWPTRLDVVVVALGDGVRGLEGGADDQSRRQQLRRHRLAWWWNAAKPADLGLMAPHPTAALSSRGSHPTAPRLPLALARAAC